MVSRDEHCNPTQGAPLRFQDHCILGFLHPKIGPGYTRRLKIPKFYNVWIRTGLDNRSAPGYFLRAFLVEYALSYLIIISMSNVPETLVLIILMPTSIPPYLQAFEVWRSLDKVSLENCPKATKDIRPLSVTGYGVRQPTGYWHYASSEPRHRNRLNFVTPRGVESDKDLLDRSLISSTTASFPALLLSPRFR